MENNAAPPSPIPAQTRFRSVRAVREPGDVDLPYRRHVRLAVHDVERLRVVALLRGESPTEIAVGKQCNVVRAIRRGVENFFRRGKVAVAAEEPNMRAPRDALTVAVHALGLL